jgi:hypothetical protein
MTTTKVTVDDVTDMRPRGRVARPKGSTDVI